MHADWEATMKYHEEAKRGVLVRQEKVPAAGKFNEQPATTELTLAGDRLLPNGPDRQTITDYSEEAIPERDPAYQLPDGTHCEPQTVEYVNAAERLALARCLEQLGMSAPRAAIMARL
jgi:hypothetical protein